jgi:hypothetical protein
MRTVLPWVLSLFFIEPVFSAALKKIQIAKNVAYWTSLQSVLNSCQFLLYFDIFLIANYGPSAHNELETLLGC